MKKFLKIGCVIAAVALACSLWVYGTALSANRDTKQLGTSSPSAYPSAFTVKASQKLYAGAILAYDGAEVLPAADTSGLIVLGRCPAYVDNTVDGKTSNADLGVFLYANDGTNPLVDSDLVAYVKDDATVCERAGVTNDVPAGLVVDVTADGVYVDMTAQGLKAARALAALLKGANVSATQAALTDSTGGTPANTLAAATAATQNTVTDSTGGVAATTLAAPTAATQDTVTDSTGGVAATTLAAPTAATQDTVTDSTGGSAGTTLAAATGATQDTVTDSTGGAASTTLAAVGAIGDVVVMKGQAGKNGAGALALTGTAVDDRVLSVINLTDVADASASFEAVITVANQIQQSSASDLSAKICLFTVARNRQAAINNGLASLAAQDAKVKVDVAARSTDAKNWVASLAAQNAKVKTDVAARSTDAKTWVASLAAQDAKVKTDVAARSTDAKTWVASLAAQDAKVKVDVAARSTDAKTWVASLAEEVNAAKTDVAALKSAENP